LRVLVLEPARTPQSPSWTAFQYDVSHPGRGGRLAAIAGIGSYLLWRSPRSPVVLDGWLEHFTPNELSANYAIVRGRPGAPTDVERLRVGAVITRDRRAAQLLEAHGFVVKASGPGDAEYLARDSHR